MLRFSATVARVSSRRCYARRRQLEVANGFEKNWQAMSDAQKAPLIKEYTVLEAQDWHTLSLEQKRAIYTIAYGPPPEVDPYQTWKVGGGVVAVLAAGIGMFALVRSGANPPPATLTPEYQRATEEYLRKNNANPIFGLSSKKKKSVEDLELQ